MECGSPLGEGESLKPLFGFGPGGWRRLLLGLFPGVVVPRHRHRGEVHTFNLAGYRQIAGRDEVIGPGGYVCRARRERGQLGRSRR